MLQLPWRRLLNGKGEISLNHTVKLAFCSVITALCVAIMFLTGIIPIGTYALPALSGVLLIPVVVELGTGWAWSVYIAASLLSFFIAADKEAVLFFILFFGYYPILKAVLERINKKAVQFFLKFAVFNASAIIEFFIAANLLNVPQDSFFVHGVYLPWAFLIAGNVIFLIYDYALSLLIISYNKKVHRGLCRLFKMK